MAEHTTHHHACDCREAYFSRLGEAAHELACLVAQYQGRGALLDLNALALAALTTYIETVRVGDGQRFEQGGDAEPKEPTPQSERKRQESTPPAAALATTPGDSGDEAPPVGVIALHCVWCNDVAFVEHTEPAMRDALIAHAAACNARPDSPALQAAQKYIGELEAALAEHEKPATDDPLHHLTGEGRC